MSRRAKPQVATYTERRKTPSLRPALIRKLARVHQTKGEPETALQYLLTLVPSPNFVLNQMIVEAFLALKMTRQAIQHLARSRLSRAEKRRLFSLIVPADQDLIRAPPLSPLLLRCPGCTRPQFFFNGELKCLVCKDAD